MNARTLAAIAAIFSSTLLIALVFAFAVWRDAFWGASSALATAAVVYVFHTLQFYEMTAAELRQRYYDPSPLSNALFPTAFVIGLASALLSFAGV